MFAGGRVAIFDFTEGEGAQKEFFATDYRFCAKTYLLRSSVANRSAVGLHHGLDCFSARVGMLLDRWHLKSRLKRMLRGQT